MNGSTPVHDGGQTVPLKEYIEALIAERDKAVKEAIRQMEQKLLVLNELRASVEEDRGLLLSRDKYDTEHKALEDRVDAATLTLSRRLDAIERDEAWVGRSGSVATLSDIKRRLEALEGWRGKAALVLAVGTFIGGLIGATVMRLFTGAFGL